MSDQERIRQEDMLVSGGLSEEETAYVTSPPEVTHEVFRESDPSGVSAATDILEAAGITESEARAERTVEENMRRRRRKHRRPSPFKIAWMIVILGIAGTVFLASGVFTTVSIRVEGNRYFTNDEVINMGHASTGKNLIFQSGARDIVKRLKANPYIEDVRISRRLPGTLVIRVQEREQVAAVVYNREYLIIDAEGRLLRRTGTKPKLTIVSGVQVRRMTLGETLETKDPDQLTQLLELLKVMRKGDLYFVRIAMKEPMIRLYIYDTMICRGEFKALIQTIEKTRLQKILKTLFDNNIHRGTITVSEDGYASFEPVVGS